MNIDTAELLPRGTFKIVHIAKSVLQDGITVILQDGSLVIQQIFNVYLLHTSTVSAAGKCKSVRKTKKQESTTTGGSRRFPRRPGPHSRPAVKCAGAVS